MEGADIQHSGCTWRVDDIKVSDVKYDLGIQGQIYLNLYYHSHIFLIYRSWVFIFGKCSLQCLDSKKVFIPLVSLE